ncbi:retrovirus-related pol polyprotein from transposon TNT 1-94 [Tanacetum coccineum]|uniref:Retrovirus-related pol polyprotein from transposon TNT 1-94 n=1 Tax=Tanacetum coccineum TaxID=301880 RepID=A0ABQ5J256_9ASTR
MLPEWSRFIIEVKLNRRLKESNFDQLYDYLKQHEVHADENRMMMERFIQPTNDPLALVSNALVTNFDDDVDDMALNVDHVFEDDQCDAFDSDVDEDPTTQTMFMYVEDNEEHVVQSNVSSVRNDALMSVLDEMHEQGVQTLTVYPPNTPVKLVPEFIQLKARVQTALFKEVKVMEEIFDQMSDEVDQNVVDKQCAEIVKKNLLIENENLIANCLSNQLLFDVEKSRCLDLEAEMSKIEDLKAQLEGNLKVAARSSVKTKVLAPVSLNKGKQIWKPKGKLSDNSLNKTKQIWQPKGKLSDNSLNKTKQVWKAMGKLVANVGYQWRPTGKKVSLGKLNCGYQWRPTGKKFALGELCPLTKLSVVQVILWYLDSGCSKHMTGNRSKLKNFVEKFIGSVRFGNDHFGAIMGYGDYVIGDSVHLRSLLTWWDLGTHSILCRAICDLSLKLPCFVRDIWCITYLKGSHRTIFYKISRLDDMMKSSQICLLSKASKPVNLEKATTSPQTKSENKNMEVLHYPSPGSVWSKSVQCINGKKYILVIVDGSIQDSHGLVSTKQSDTSKQIMERNSSTKLCLNTMKAEAVATACYTQNRSLIHTRHNKTPYELVHDKKPDLTFLRVFGALCYPTNDSEDLGKFQAKADIGIFVGYAPSRKGYRIYNKRTRRLMETIHVTFDEMHQTMAPVRISSGPEPIMMTPG